MMTDKNVETRIQNNNNNDNIINNNDNDNNNNRRLSLSNIIGDY